MKSITNQGDILHASADDDRLFYGRGQYWIERLSIVYIWKKKNYVTSPPPRTMRSENLIRISNLWSRQGYAPLTISNPQSNHKPNESNLRVLMSFPRRTYSSSQVDRAKTFLRLGYGS